jgi:hypothetical protein
LSLRATSLFVKENDVKIQFLQILDESSIFKD